MDLEIKRQIMEVPDLRHRVRQLRWFKTSFRQHARLIAQHHGLTVTIDDTRLTEAFLNWAERFAQDRGYARLDGRDFATFMAGLLLRELLATHPLSAQAIPGDASPALRNDVDWTLVHEWPEGFIVTNYCLCVLAAVLEQDGTPLTLPALASDLRTWWSYRENVGRDPSRAIGFLDLFTGAEPNWYMPDSVASRAAVKRALAAKLVPLAEAQPQLP
ncbi:hypothetical protein P7D22_13030 [Lichenihabitans sp. Uapishka_5]|uniref:hypothetical protein n=1 Tax=Lichenihabitans sp. Uapishka_5 TaxID=3037302 RepID=UPI0029E7DC3A|nr:hypothetical protein [Lichenihabitans sp. Uapishka_5]MDX7952097.1 hypothetical protein [Lichenihabitans sp. Uapishka_5]